MKSRAKVVLITLAALIVASIVGFCIYLNTPVSNERYGVTMSVSDVSPTGLRLDLTKEDYGRKVVVVTAVYDVEKWTVLGWKKAAANSWYLETEFPNELSKFEVGESFALELEWEKAYGRLPSGLYRISKSVEDERIYAPFFAINWWQILQCVIVLVIVAGLIWAEWRYSLWGKMMTFVLRRKIVSLVVLGVLLILSVASFLIYLYEPLEDARLGIDIQASEGSTTGVKLQLTREDEGSEWKVTALPWFGFEKWTLFGWKKVDIAYISGGYSKRVISDEDSERWMLSWEAYAGKQSSGLYRITKEVTARKGSESLEQKYHAPFLIVNPVEMIYVYIGIVLLAFLVHLKKKYPIVIKQYKKRSVVVGLVVILAIYATWMVWDMYSTERSSAAHGYEVVVGEAGSEEVTWTLNYDDGEKGVFLRQKQFSSVEKWTILGWKEVKVYDEQPTLDKELVRCGGTAEGRLTFHMVDQFSKGTYRIKQPFEFWSKQDGAAIGTGEVYIEFEVK